jgi:hypothetical protein
MSWALHPRLFPRPLAGLLLALMAAVFSLSGCNKVHKTDLTPLDKAGILLQDAGQFRALNITDAEVQELVAARQGGVSEQACLELMRIARGRNQPFVDGNAASALVGTGMKEATVLELGRLNQLGLQTGETQAMFLAHLSDQVILAIAHRRAAGMPTLSGSTAAALQNDGSTEDQILAEINSGTTDAAANAMIARRNAAAASQGFVRQPPRRRRR